MTTGRARYESLDAWRGIACLLVIVFHTVGREGTPSASWLLTVLGRMATHGWIGVSLFFVISGYCIGASASRPQRLPDYFLRRLRRIFPPLWIFLGLTAHVVLAVSAAGLWTPVFGHRHGGSGGFSQIVSPSDLSAWTVVSNLTLTAGWAGRLRGPFLDQGWWMGHLWSLGYEEQFYLVVGLLLVTLRAQWWRGVEALTLAIAVLSWARPDDSRFSGLFFDGYWLLFALGLLLFHHINIASGVRRWLLPVVLASAAIALAPSLGSATARGKTALAFATLFTIALVALHPWDRHLAGARAARPLAWCGRRCYSVYLVHGPVVKALTGVALVLGLVDPYAMWCVVVPAAIAVSLLVAHPFHLYVERRFLNTPAEAVNSRWAIRHAKGAEAPVEIAGK